VLIGKMKRRFSEGNDAATYTCSSDTRRTLSPMLYDTQHTAGCIVTLGPLSATLNCRVLGDCTRRLPQSRSPAVSTCYQFSPSSSTYAPICDPTAYPEQDFYSLEEAAVRLMCINLPAAMKRDRGIKERGRGWGLDTSLKQIRIFGLPPAQRTNSHGSDVHSLAASDYTNCQVGPRARTTRGIPADRCCDSQPHM